MAAANFLSFPIQQDFITSKGNRFLRLVVEKHDFPRIWTVWCGAEAQLSQHYSVSLACYQIENVYLIILGGTLEFIYSALSLFVPEWSENSIGLTKFDIIIKPCKWTALVMNTDLDDLLKSFRSDMAVSQENPYYPGEVRISVTGIKQSVIWPLINIVNLSGEHDVPVNDSSTSVTPRVSTPQSQTPSAEIRSPQMRPLNVSLPISPPFSYLPSQRCTSSNCVGVSSPGPSNGLHNQGSTPSPLEIFQALSSLLPSQTTKWPQKQKKRRNCRNAKRTMQ